MFRYLCFCWNHEDRLQAERILLLASVLTSSSSKWIRALQGEDFIALYTGERPNSLGASLLANNRGVGFGTVFATHQAPQSRSHAIQAFDQVMTDRIVQSRGRALVSDFWGRYVALLSDPSTLTTCVIRDPTGQIPCYYCHTGQLVIFFSALEDCYLVANTESRINWKFVRNFASNPELRCSQTGFDNISELQPGECIQINSQLKLVHRMYWTPHPFVHESFDASLQDTVKAVRSTTDSCVHSWGALHANIMHKLSGGLDSSVVAYSLKSCPTAPNVFYLNYVTPLGGDERAYSQAVAADTGSELIQQVADVSSICLQAAPLLSPAPRPRSYHYELRHGAFQRDLASQCNISAFFDGVGGDHIFFQSPLEIAPAEHLIHQGPRIALLRLILGVSITTRRTVWSILKEMRRSLRGPKDLKQFAGTIDIDRCLTAEARMDIAADNLEQHPWLNASSLTLGKLHHAAHVLSLAHSHSFYPPFHTTSEWIEDISPLSSQPLIELCLRIPIPKHLENGWDRALERLAFSDVLPDRIAKRRAKGNIGNTTAKIYTKNRSFIHEYLLDGELVQHRILNRRILEEELDKGTASPLFGLFTYHYLALEKWLRECQVWAVKGQEASILPM